MDRAKKSIDDFFDFIKKNYLAWRQQNTADEIITGDKLPEYLNVFDSTIHKTSVENICRIETRTRELCELIEKTQKELNELSDEYKTNKINKVAEELGKLFTKTDIFFKKDKDINLFWEIFEEYAKKSQDFLDCRHFIFPSLSDKPKEKTIVLPKCANFDDSTFQGTYHFATNDEETHITLSLENIEFERLIFSGISIEHINFNNSISESGALFFEECVFLNPLNLKRVNIGTLTFYDCLAAYNEGEYDGQHLLNLSHCNFGRIGIFDFKAKQDQDEAKNQENNIKTKILPIADKILLHYSNIEKISIKVLNSISLDIQELNKLNKTKKTFVTPKEHFGVSIKSDKNINIQMENNSSEINMNIESKQNIDIKVENSKIAGVIKANKNINKIIFNGCKIFDKLVIKSKNIQEVEISNSTISKHLDINDMHSYPHKKITFQNTTFDKDSLLKLGNSYNISYDLIIFKHVYNFGFILMSNITINKAISFIGSVMGKTELNSVDIEKAQTIINNSSINEVTLYNVNFGQAKNIKTNQDGFRQLKYISEKAGNNIGAVKFYAEELEKYKANKEVSTEDRFLLAISYALSNHGQSYMIPIVWFFTIATITIYEINTFIINGITTAFIAIPTFMTATVIYCANIKSDYIYKKRFIYILLVIPFLTSFCLVMFVQPWDYLSISANFANPFSTNLKEIIYEIEKAQPKYNSALGIAFSWILYKTAFILIGYHLVVALKRMTKF